MSRFFEKVAERCDPRIRALLDIKCSQCGRRRGAPPADRGGRRGLMFGEAVGGWAAPRIRPSERSELAFHREERCATERAKLHALGTWEPPNIDGHHSPADPLQYGTYAGGEVSHIVRPRIPPAGVTKRRLEDACTNRPRAAFPGRSAASVGACRGEVQCVPVEQVSEVDDRGLEHELIHGSARRTCRFFRVQRARSVTRLTGPRGLLMERTRLGTVALRSVAFGVRSGQQTART